MNGLWRRILLGALAIFAVGYGVISLVRLGKGKVQSALESADPVRIPLPFLPFLVDGSRVGTLESVTLLRSAPRQVSGVEVRAKLGNTVAVDRFRECQFTSRSATTFSPESGLACLRAGPADSSLVVVGTVTLSGADGATLSLPLLLPPEVLATIRPGLADSASPADASAPSQPTNPMAAAAKVAGKVVTKVSDKMARDSAQSPP